MYEDFFDMPDGEAQRNQGQKDKKMIQDETDSDEEEMDDDGSVDGDDYKEKGSESGIVDEDSNNNVNKSTFEKQQDKVCGLVQCSYCVP